MKRWASLLASLLVGCPDGGFDWRGGEAGVSFAWTIDGEQAGAAACAAIAATRARLVLRVDGGRWVEPDLEWSCATGAATSGAVFDAATLDFGVELLDPEDRVVAWSAWTRRTVAPGGNDLGIFDLRISAPSPDASLRVRWRIGGGDATAETCAAAGGVRVRLDWRIGGLAGEAFEWPCAGGEGRAELALRSGQELDLRLGLLDADGYTVAVAPRDSWYLATLDPGDNELEPFDLAGAAERVPLAVVLFWADRAGDSATYVNCAAAGAERIGFRLENRAGAVVDAADLATAPLACTDYLSWPAVVPDTYTMAVEAQDESGERAWSVECWGLGAADPVDNTFVCRVPRLR